MAADEKDRQRRRYELRFLATLSAFTLITLGLGILVSGHWSGIVVILAGVCSGYFISPKLERKNVLWSVCGILSGVSFVVGFGEMSDHGVRWESSLPLLFAIMLGLGPIIHYWDRFLSITYWSVRILYYCFIALLTWSIVEGASEQIDSFLLSPVGNKPDFQIQGIGSISGIIMGITVVLAIGRYGLEYARRSSVVDKENLLAPR